MIGKYKYTEKEIKELLASIVIIVDTREKPDKNKHITDWFDKNKIKYVRQKLDQGDYSFYLPRNHELNIDRDTYFDGICIERKNGLDELASNFSQDRERIKNEFIQYNGNMTLLIENDSYKDLCDSNYRSKYDVKSFIGTLHSFSDRYNIHFIFIDSNYSARYIYSKFYYYLRNLIK